MIEYQILYLIKRNYQNIRVWMHNTKHKT